MKLVVFSLQIIRLLFYTFFNTFLIKDFSPETHIFIHLHNKRHTIYLLNETFSLDIHRQPMLVKTFKRSVWPVCRKIPRQVLHSFAATPSEPFIWSHKQLKVSWKIKIHDKCTVIEMVCLKHWCGHKWWAKTTEPQNYKSIFLLEGLFWLRKVKS